VRDVANGLQFRFICFECSQPVIARQGAKVRWHFAHHAPTNCRPTPESELHFFAKSLLAEHLWLWIPAVHAHSGRKTKRLSDCRKYEFAEVRVEKADGNVRPDLLLITAGGKTLHIEIFVRHRVDAAKLEKLKIRGISSVEIDLSHIDWDERDGWETAILETAPRQWLHNARAAEVQEEMAIEAALEAERNRQMLEAEFARVSSAWEQACLSHDAPDQALIVEHELALKRGFRSKIGHAVKGSACFRVPAAFWQSRIVNRFLWNEATGSPRAFETRHVLAHVQDLVRPGLGRVSKETMAQMQEAFPEFQNPWHVVHAYLKWLKEQHWMFDKRVIGKQWLPSGSALHHRKEREADWQRERERTTELIEWVDYILSNIPEDEVAGFDRAKWVSWFAASYDEDDARPLHEAIHDMVVGGRGLAEDFLGLPLAAEYERQESSQRERRLEAERRRLAQLEQEAQDRRISAIQVKAVDVLAGQAQHWLNTLNANVGGNTPLCVAEESEAGFTLATAELERLRNERREAASREATEIRLQAALEKNRAELAELAKQRARDPVRAGLWCKSPNPKLGGQRPFDYCTDDRALKTCKEIMPASL
jgi:hypothetical protein